MRRWSSIREERYTMKAVFDSLAIEITRRCNMQCEHCMRGEAQNKDISFEVIDRLLENTKAIGTLTLTGGEPSLNVPAIEYIAKRIEELDIELGAAFIVTNGKEVPNEFLLACLKLFVLADKKELNGIALSQDMFHEEVPRENVARLAQLAAFDRSSKRYDFNRVPLFELGRARVLNGFRKRPKVYYGLDAAVEDGGKYLRFKSVVTTTVDGDMLTDCDYDYDDTDNIEFANVLLNQDWLNKIVAEYTDGVA